MIRRRIFLVDDDVDLRKTLTEQLSHYREFDLVEGGTAADAIRGVGEAHVDLMILDVGLPDMDGRETVKILRREGFKSPILMLTGHDSGNDEGERGERDGGEQLRHGASPGALGRPVPTTPALT